MTTDPEFNARRDDDRRLGCFEISQTVIRYEPARALAILQGAIVVRAELRWDRDAVAYMALHPDFEVVPPGQIVPDYRTVVCETRSETWEVERVVKWCKGAPPFPGDPVKADAPGPVRPLAPVGSEAE